MKEKKQFCWFFTNRQLAKVIGVFIIGFVLLITAMASKLHFLDIQRKVQNGELSVWKMYLIFLIITDLLQIIKTIFNTIFKESVQRYLQFNLFKRYQRFFRIQEKGVMIAYNIIYNIVNLPVIIMSSCFNIYLVGRTMKMVKYDTLHIIVAIFIFVLAIITGFFRGKTDAVREREKSKISQKKGDLTKYEIFSREFLECALYVLDIEYYSKLKMSIKKDFLEKIPEIAKQILYVILVWGLVNTLATGEVYSQSYLLLTAFDVIISISEEIGKLIEAVISIWQLKKDENFRELNAFEERENTLLEINKSFISLDEKGLLLSPLISLNVKSAAGKEKYYKPSTKIKVKRGENAWLVGAKEVGKTRLLMFVKDMFPNSVMIYNDNGKIFNDFRENLKCNYEIDWDLVRKLAQGLRLERIAKLSDNELKKLDLSNINTGDKHLCVALVMFYYAIKDSTSAKLIILDELFANVDEDNSKEILKFIDEIKQEIGCSYIFVGHSKHELFKQYCTSCIKLRSNSDTITVSQSIIS